MGNKRQALYRKYRSRSLDEVVGQSHVTEVLAAALAKDQTSHAYLLTGPKGTGKTSVARIIAHMVNDLSYGENQNLDIIEIDAASNNGVDDVRDLREKVNIAPVSAKYKIYIIDEVHMLSGAAFNALLKTLEEPPEHVIFVLATTEVQKLPATILSRVQRYHFRPVEPQTVADHLRTIADQEKIKVDDDALLLLAERGQGSFRDSISMLDQLSGLGSKITRAKVEEILGLAPTTKIDELVTSVIERDAQKVIAILREFRDQGIATSVVVDQLLTKLSELAPDKPKLYDLIERLIEVPKSACPDVKLTAILASASAKSTTLAQSTTTQPAIEVPLTAIKKAGKNEEKLARLIEKNIQSEVQESKTLAPINAPTKIDWPKVVAEVKTLNPPVAAVVSKADVAYENGQLTMYFQYKIYRGKMSSDHYRKILAEATNNLYEFTPTITIAPNVKPRDQKSDATIATVTAIMGGGDLVNA